MLKLVTVAFAILALAAASHFEYLNNGMEYNISPNIISPLPYPYRDEFSPPCVSPGAPKLPKTELVSSKLSLVATAASHAVAYANLVVSFLIKNFSALILGSTVALGICKLTSLCSQGDTIFLLQNEICSFATPQRLKRAAELVESAIRKYNTMQ